MVIKSINFHKITPEDYKNSISKKLSLKYGNYPTKFGNCIIAFNNSNQLCYCSFLNNQKDITDSDLARLIRIWPNVDLLDNNEYITEMTDKLFDENVGIDLNIVMKGTEFEMTVWQELTKLKAGTTVSYEAVAKAIGKPKATRAVARTIAKNFVGIFVPCHRVISKSGAIHNYGWGKKKKEQLLKYEKAI